MTGPKFFQTRMGTRFFEIDVPAAIKAVVRLAEAVEDHALPPFSRKYALEQEKRLREMHEVMREAVPFSPDPDELRVVLRAILEMQDNPSVYPDESVKLSTKTIDKIRAALGYKG